MNFSILGAGSGFIGGIVLVGAVMIVVVIAFMVIQRVVQGTSETIATDERVPDDDYPV